jgi:hypothetical protein
VTVPVDPGQPHAWIVQRGRSTDVTGGDAELTGLREDELLALSDETAFDGEDGTRFYGSCQAARIRSMSGRTRARASTRGTPAISSSS